MKTKLVLLSSVFFITINIFSQQVGDGYAPVINDFSAPLKSGVYNGLSPSTVGMTADNSNLWQHLFVIRHSNTSSNYQLQLASSFAVNDRVFFRKITSATLSSVNANWVELATRGKNNFVGDQSISGNVAINSLSPLNTFEVKVPTSTGASSSDGIAIHDGAVYRLGINIGVNTDKEYSYIQAVKGGIGSKNIIINPIGGNVGIGITNPTNKLDVKGTIHSQEVKVDMNNWSDFVFKKEYNLPTLEEVENHIAEKGHLENIPSEEEVLKNGINLGEMNAKLLQKIEELTLYAIEQSKRNNKQSVRIEKLEKENETFKDVLRRLSKIEEKLK
ncbi:hypothetical protein [Flavobacterium pectinovorum]|uniref:Cell wall anchor protein n=1 Tax=Flavobacterium pectinovorum TaxID=29533 RepID=A0A502EGW7_9FLAO|nr:hypothetical protein [Flavobacterium pectinovorum]TPG36289.1 hypothetical protein EAH81_19650 [Flavobacterium pectinovorum]